MSFSIFEEQDSNEEVKEEEATYEDKDDEEDGMLHVVLKFRTIAYLRYVHSLVHDPRPALKRRDYKESRHSLTNIIKVRIIA